MICNHAFAWNEPARAFGICAGALRRKHPENQTSGDDRGAREETPSIDVEFAHDTLPVSNAFGSNIRTATFASDLVVPPSISSAARWIAVRMRL